MLSFIGKIPGDTKKALSDVAHEAFLFLGDDFEVNLSFITKEKMIELNKKYNNKEEVTDILSFRLDNSENGGDIVIARGEAERRAKEWRVDNAGALSLLLAHGILHLAGYGHSNASERAKMEKAEEYILKKAGVEIER